MMKPIKTETGVTDVGEEMYALIRELYPICRSITGDGVRQTLEAIKKHIPVCMHEVPSGTKVFDWTVPREWNIRDAYIKNAKGEKIIDFKKSNLHVLNYSSPIHKKMPFSQLKQHLHTLPDHPEWIPYRTSYYKEKWGFCLSHRQYEQMDDDEYEVHIDSSLENGSLTYGEYVLQGRTGDEILFSCHICHPSLCNDNLSGIALVTFLAKILETMSRRYSYRFLFIPGTIGAITWLSLNEKIVPRIKHGLVVANVGDSGHLSYKKSKSGNAEIDQIVQHYLKHSHREYEIHDFSPYGYDERQYCSPGFNLPVGSLTRSIFGRFPEYHTSADNLDFVHPEYLKDSLNAYVAICTMLEANQRYVNQNPKCEPNLGKRGLYDDLGGSQQAKERSMAMLWLLSFSDGQNSLIDIAEKSNMSFEVIYEAALLLEKHDLIRLSSERTLVDHLRMEYREQ
jgi:aminopeptidase-like protein